MKPNMGNSDRGARVVLGLAIAAAGLYFKSWFGLVSLVPLATAMVGWCPLYVPFAISTWQRRVEGSSS